MSKNRKNRVYSNTLKPADIDVVVVTGGRWDFLKECLEALRKQTVPVNVILLDNASDLTERQQNNVLFEGLTTKRLQQSLGFPAANNEGARMGSAPLILFLNDDCVLKENAIEKMVETMKDPTIGVCGAKLLFPTASTSPNRPAGKVQHIGMGLTIRGDVVHPLLGWSADNPKCCISRDVFCVTGACMMTRRDLFRKTGGFDPVFGAGTFEDVDLCLKIRGLGKRIFVNCEAQGFHYAGATVEKKGVGFPLQMNSLIFQARWRGSLQWDEWIWY